MESTHSYTQRTTFSGLRTLLEKRIVRFVNQNPDVFAAICRSGAPFGGNCLPTSQYPTTRKPSDTTQHELALIQRQLNGLTEQVAQLTDKLNKTQSTRKALVGQSTHKPAPANQIGINRFLALQASGH